MRKSIQDTIGQPVPRLALNLKEAAAALGMSERSLRRLVASGLIRPNKSLRTLRFTQRELERFLNDTN